MLQDYLGGSDQETTNALVQESGWSLKQEGGVSVVAIRNQEANIRPKKILAKIEFDSEWVWSRAREWSCVWGVGVVTCKGVYLC